MFWILRQKYKDRKTGETRESAKWYVEFVDHLRIRRRWPAFEDKKRSNGYGLRLERLVRARTSHESPDPDLAGWIESLPRETRERLVSIGLLDARQLIADKPLDVLLDGTGVVTGGDVVTFRQHLAAKGNTAEHVAQTVKQIRRVLDGCGLVFWSDLARPDVPTRIETFLAELREEERDDDGKRTRRAVMGQTGAYYVKAVRAFAKWLAAQRGSAVNPLADLEAPKGADGDKSDRRHLSVEEVRTLLRLVIGQGLPQDKRMPVRVGLEATDRAVLYFAAYETGLRPGTLERLTVASFDLDADPPTVFAKAGTMKRRKSHTQIIRPETAAVLKRLFANRTPAAAAFRVPSKWRRAEMIRADMEDARARWIAEAKGDAKEQERRQRSDFLAAVDRQGRPADFYSLRHSHGSAMAGAGVPQRSIQASLHHTRSSTTDRYVHADLDGRQAAIAMLPKVLDGLEQLPQAEAATGTDGAPADGAGVAYTGAYSDGAGSGGSKRVGETGETAKFPEKPLSALGLEPRTYGLKVGCETTGNKGDSADSAPRLQRSLQRAGGARRVRPSADDGPAGGVDGVLGRLADGTRRLCGGG